MEQIKGTCLNELKNEKVCLDCLTNIIDAYY